MSRTIRPEPQRALAAFEIYFTMGDARSLRKLAETTKISYKTIEKWSVKFNWQDRVRKRNEEAAKALARQNDKQIFDDKMHYRDLIKKSLAVFETNLNVGKVDIASVKEALSLIDMDMRLMDSMSSALHAELDANTTSSSGISQETSSTLDVIYHDIANLDEDTENESTNQFG